jgi:hypothetical protein
MKYTITLLLLAVMSAPFSAVAEGEKPPVSDEQLNNMQKRLELTDEQVTEMRKIRDEGGSKKDLRAVLTPEQRAKAKQKSKGKSKEKPKGKGSKGSLSDEQLSKMQEKLQLSDQQVSKMRQIREAGGNKKDMFAVLNDEQKAQAKKMNRKRKEKGENNARKNAGDV